MKNPKILLLSIVSAALCAFAPLRCSAQIGQTNEPPPVAPSIPAGPINFNFLTNVPLQGDLTLAKAGLSTGMMLKNGTIENENKFDFNFHTNWVASISEQNAPSASVIDSLSLHFGYRLAWPNAEILGQLLGRRNWSGSNPALTPAGWQAGINLDAFWLPLTGGKLFMGTSVKFLTSSTGDIFKKAPGLEWDPILVKINF